MCVCVCVALNVNGGFVFELRVLMFGPRFKSLCLRPLELFLFISVSVSVGLFCIDAGGFQDKHIILKASQTFVLKDCYF